MSIVEVERLDKAAWIAYQDAVFAVDLLATKPAELVTRALLVAACRAVARRANLTIVCANADVVVYRDAAGKHVALWIGDDPGFSNRAATFSALEYMGVLETQ